MRKSNIYKVGKTFGAVRYTAPIGIGLILSGCVSNDMETSLASDFQNITPKTAQQELALADSSTVQAADGIPIPASGDANLVTAYSADSESGKPLAIAASQPSNGTSAPDATATLAGGILANAKTSENSATSPASDTVKSGHTNEKLNSLFAALENQQTSATVSPVQTNSEKKKGSFFAKLFKSKPTQNKKTATISKPTVTTAVVDETTDADRTEVAALQTADLTKKETKPQITQASQTAQASAAPLPSNNKKKNSKGFLSSFFGSKSKQNNFKVEAPKIEVAALGGLARLSPLALQRQTERVDVACFKPELVRVLKKIEDHYKSPVIVTSGYRSPKENKRIGGASGSKHTTCEAADVQIKGVTKWELAKYARSMPGRGGVGTYCHTRSVHIDIGSERDWNWRCRKRKKK